MSSDSQFFQDNGLLSQLVSGSDVTFNQHVSEPALAYTSSIKSDRSFLKLVHVARKGLSYSKFKIAERALELSKQQLASLLHISDRTLDRIHKDKKRLSTPQTERVLELSMLYEHGWECFGNHKNFRLWLDDAYIPFGGITPLSLLDTSHGIEMIHKALGRIEYGVIA